MRPLSVVLLDCRRQGVHLWLKDGRPQAGPKERLTPDLLAGLRDHKPTIIRLLADHEPAPPTANWDSLLARAVVEELLAERDKLESQAAWQAVAAIEDDIDDCFLREDLAGLLHAAGQWRATIQAWKGEPRAA